jgi:hypothetical protein
MKSAPRPLPSFDRGFLALFIAWTILTLANQAA